MKDEISQSVERLLEFTMPMDRLEADEQAQIEAPMNLGLNVVRRIYGAGTSDLARYCRRYDYMRRRGNE